MTNFASEEAAAAAMEEESAVEKQRIPKAAALEEKGKGKVSFPDPP